MDSELQQKPPKRSRGRPPKNVIQRTYTLEQSVAEFIDSLPDGQRSEFVNIALKEHIQKEKKAMTTNVKQLTEGMIFYNFPWGEPTKAVVLNNGQMYEVRESWGCAEGWTNDHGATPMSDEDVEQYSDALTEMSTAEIAESFSIETLEGIVEAVKAASEKA